MCELLDLGSREEETRNWRDREKVGSSYHHERVGILQYPKEVTSAVESKTLNALQSWTKYLTKSKKIKQNVTMGFAKNNLFFRFCLFLS